MTQKKRPLFSLLLRDNIRWVMVTAAILLAGWNAISGQQEVIAGQTALTHRIDRVELKLDQIADRVGVTPLAQR